MLGYQSRFVGLERLPKNLSAFDVELFFCLSQELIEAIHKYAHLDRHPGAETRKLALGAQLVFMRTSGRSLDQVSHLPKELIRYLGKALHVSTPAIASLKAIYRRRPRTLYDHQRWARERLGLLDFDDAQEKELVGILLAQANEEPSLGDLASAAKLWLFENQILIPAERALVDLARKAFLDVERATLRIIQENVSSDERSHCRRVIFSTHMASQSTVLQWLRTPPKRHRPSTLNETLAKITFLKELNADKWDLRAIPLARQHAYAQSLAARPPTDSRKLKESMLVLEVICFLRYTLLELTDSALFQTGRRVSDFMREAKLKNTERRARSLTEFVEGISTIKEHVEDDTRSADERLAAIAEIVEALHVNSPNSQAAGMRNTLAEDPARVHSLLSALANLEFKGLANDPAAKQLALWRALREQGLNEIPAGTEVPVGKVWQEMVNGDDRRQAFKALEASVAMSMHRSLRRGSIWVEHSLTFRERDQMLIPPDEWAFKRERYLSEMQLPADPVAYIEPLLQHIGAGLEAVAEAHELGRLSIDKNGLLHLTKLEALPFESEPKRTVELLYSEIGAVQFSDVMLEVDALTNFSAILLGHRPRDEQELVALYGALIAHGRDIDAKSMAAMIPQLDPGLVSAAMRALETPGRLDRANRCVVEFQRKHWLAELWGSGESGSADMMAIDASPHLFKARVDPKRRVHAVGIYTHVLDHHGIAHNLPVIAGERQAGPALHGAREYNRHGGALRRLAVDTHGYTNVAMGVAGLDGLDLCPRLRNVSERKLFLPRGMDLPEGIERLARGDVSLNVIKKGWDEVLRALASVRSGRTSVDVLMLRLGSAAQGDPMHDAADHLGRLRRTLFLCDYFSNPAFRREILILLNRGEAMHQLQRVVHEGKIAAARGRRGDELLAISGSHALLTNLVIAFNTHRMQSVAEQWRRTGRALEDGWLRRMSPAHWSNINFDGTIQFGVDRYREVLLQPVTRQRRRSA